MACKVKVNRHGVLAFRLYWNGIKAWEGTGLKGNSKNRQRVEARAVLIYEEWIKGKKPPLVRKSRERDYRQAFNKHTLPFLGDIPVGQITPRKLEDFRIYLLEQAKLSLKSARNIIDAYLRAMMRDARNVDHLISKDPFAALEWKKQTKEEPDPFTEEELDKILEFYRERRPYKAYVFVHNQFWTGMRPSEATALRRGKVDLTSGKAMIVRS